jgi:Ca2+-binding EF-hand superfamily protein
MTEKEIRDILANPEALDEIVTYVFKKIDADGSGEIEIDEIEDLMLAFA